MRGGLFMSLNKKDEVWNQWVNRAKDFLKWSKDNYKEENYPLVCYLCQQSVELLLKGWLYKLEIVPPKTHMLLRLSKLLGEKNIDLSELSEELSRLSEYYFESRYPGDETIVALGEEYAKQALEDGGEVWAKFNDWRELNCED